MKYSGLIKLWWIFVLSIGIILSLVSGFLLFASVYGEIVDDNFLPMYALISLVVSLGIAFGTGVFLAYIGVEKIKKLNYQIYLLEQETINGNNSNNGNTVTDSNYYKYK